MQYFETQDIVFASTLICLGYQYIHAVTKNGRTVLFQFDMSEDQFQREKSKYLEMKEIWVVPQKLIATQKMLRDEMGVVKNQS